MTMGNPTAKEREARENAMRLFSHFAYDIRCPSAMARAMDTAVVWLDYFIKQEQRIGQICPVCGSPMPKENIELSPAMVAALGEIPSGVTFVGPDQSDVRGVDDGSGNCCRD